MRKNKKLIQEEFIYYFWDIETSRIPIDQRKDNDIKNSENYLQVCYLSNILKFNVITGEEIESFFDYSMSQVVDRLKDLSKNKKIVIFSHNLGYEMEFLLRETGANGLVNNGLDSYGLENNFSVLRDTHEPLKIILDVFPNIEFRDSLALLNKSVKKLGEDLEKKGLQLPKLDYNYEKIRLPNNKESLTELDYKYNKRDNEIVAYSIYYWIKDNDYLEKWDKLPLTFTRNTKNAREKHIINNFSKNHLASLNALKGKELKDYEFYKLEKLVYQGGLTTITKNSMGKIYKDVYSVDFKSSYPNIMVSKKFPLYLEENTILLKGEKANIFYMKHLHKKTNEELKKEYIKGYMGLITLYNLKIKSDEYLLPLSFSHCIKDSAEGIKLLNGKVLQAEEIMIPINDIQMDIINLCYDYEYYYIDYLYLTTECQRFKEQETDFILKCFDTKENIDKEKYPIDYMLSKVYLNSLYGVKAQDEIKDRIIIKNGITEKIQFKDIENKENVYYNFKNEIYKKAKRVKGNGDFDLFCNGIYITDYARLELIKAMIYLIDSGMKILYCDTDSLKFTVNKKALEIKGNSKTNKEYKNISITYIISQILQKYNTNKENENKNNKRFIQYKNRHKVEEQEFNKICKLGTLEIENYINSELVPYEYFKTLGSKKYAYIHGNELHTTIAGCSKKINKVIENECKNKNESLLYGLKYIFRQGTLFNENVSGRTTAYYEKRNANECKKYTYNGIPLNSAGGTQIIKNTYFLNITENDSMIIYQEPRKTDIICEIGG